MPSGVYPRALQRDYKAEIKRLDDLSRTRALTEAESLLLERYLTRVHRKSTRAPYGNTKALARAGVKRSQVLA